MIFLPLVLAVMVDRVSVRGLATFYRVILLIPAVIPGPMIFVMWRLLYNYEIGPINYLLVDVLGLFTKANAPQWVGNPTLVIPAVSIFEWWWGLGYHTMFFLAGLAAIPKDLYEAARMDGCNTWQTLFRVMMPLITNGLVVLIIINFVSAWGEYLFAATLTSDQSQRTLIVVLARAFGGVGQFSYPRLAAAYAMVILPGVLAFALAQRLYFKGLTEGAIKL